MEPSVLPYRRVLLRAAAALSVVALVAPSACGLKTVQRTTLQPAELPTTDHRPAYLKLHLENGHLFILSDWHADSTRGHVSGHGVLLDHNRQTLSTGDATVPFGDIVLVETNAPRRSGALVAMAVITGVSAAGSVYCVANPKSCFGSCPTFYIDTSAGRRLVGEGFSSSIAPSLESTDVDALFDCTVVDGQLELHVTNEALETHVIRSANLLAIPNGTDGERCVALEGGGFRRLRTLTSPAQASDSEGSCLEQLKDLDGDERFSLADSTDLATRECIELTFDNNQSGELGLVIGARQTLLSTYLFYQALAFMGDQAGSLLAQLERGAGETAAKAAGIGDVLGGIEIRVADSGDNWQTVGVSQETGPLAVDLRCVPLPNGQTSPLRAQLRLTRGHWRLDYVALAELGDSVEPQRLEPAVVRRHGHEDSQARTKLLSSEETLVTLPGDEYTLVYQLPAPDLDYELFLESRGYYLEWLREEWRAEENPVGWATLFLKPSLALKQLAPAYKAIETDMEAIFWSSRYAIR